MAHGGIFQSKVDTARLFLSASQFENAEAKAAEALAYQKANPTYIKDALPALRVQADAQTRIYQKILVSANALADQGKLKEAEAEARKAIGYQADHTGAIAEPSAAENALLRVKGLQYKENIAKARTLVQQQQFRQALPLLDEAVQIEAEFKVTKDAGLWTLTQSAAKPIVLEDYARGQQLAQANKLPEARNIAQAAQAFAEKYRLQGDAAVTQAGAALGSAISSQECINAQTAFDGMIETAATQRRQKQYIEAAKTYEQALEAVGKQAACGIDTRRAIEGRVEIAVAVQYQQLLVDCQTAIDRNDNQKAIDTYNRAGELFASENLGQRFGLAHASLFDYILGSGRLEFIRHGAQYFTEKKDYDHAVDLLHKAVQMRVSKGLVKDLMVRLGTELAIRDKQAAAGSDPKTKVLEYTRGNTNLKGLEKAYLKARK